MVHPDFGWFMQNSKFALAEFLDLNTLTTIKNIIHLFFWRKSPALAHMCWLGA